MDWDTLRDMKAPHLPVLSSETDTQHFDEFEPATETTARAMASAQTSATASYRDRFFQNFAYRAPSVQSVSQRTEG